ncbi:hypothetical protein GGH94_003286 [Coemansia aciculifera]|uniref:Cation-transporting P-type ATPase N-terminal domain-containing protein n=1 Tax=Coemansia aciculifera TaxID=417176 RepID=A0A9W8IMH2_9FUNG|nr:hypothetical protein GGH94_003286 [Coemansia aciculifera]
MEERRHLEHLSDLQRRVHAEWRPWGRTLSEVADSLGVDPSRGLDRLDARNRREHFGPNIPVDLGQRLSLWSVLCAELAEPMVLLLVGVGVLYSMWGDPWDAVTIFVAIGAVVSLGAYTEWRSKQALASLRNSVPSNTTVLRDGCEGVVSADDMVPGEVIVLRHGQSVPADAVVALSHNLTVDEGVLTGESQSVNKVALGSSVGVDSAWSDDGSIESVGGGNASRLVLSNIPATLLCAGTTVTTGRAVAIVVATGSHTAISANIHQLLGRGTKPHQLAPTQQRMARLAGKLSLVAIAASLLMTGVGILVGDMHWRSTLLMGMSLAFATIPEELPLVARASLALGSRALARDKLLVRRVAAADALSSVSVIVTDKTGTLTRSQLIVSSIMSVCEDPAAGCGLAVEVLTPEAIQLSERSAALATPLYSTWSLSVDPLESRPLMQRLAAIHRRGILGQQSLRRTPTMGLRRRPSFKTGMMRSPPFEPVRGFGKDFLNSAVLNSLPAGDDDTDDTVFGGVEGVPTQLPRDSETGSIPVLAITDAIFAVCDCLSEPTGELPFDPTLRVSARTRTAAAPPVSYSQRRRPHGKDADTKPDDDAEMEAPARAKHWTVIKGAPEALVPQCTRVWRAAAGAPPLLTEDIRGGRVAGIEAMPDSLALTISRSAAKLAAGGSRVIAYALAITDEPLYASTNFVAPPATATLDVETAAASPPNQKPPVSQVLPSNLVFVGAFAFFDPPQREARPVVQECQDAGIRVILATGDHPSTALAVASTVGIVESHSRITAAIADTPSPLIHHGERAIPASYGAIGGSSMPCRRSPSASGAAGAHGGCVSAEVHAVTGEMVQRSLVQGSFDQLIDESNVFARVSPAQKLRLIHALQARGEVVAFIGDGINDAPSLTRADVGICMGANPSTADVAMDAAGLIVLSGNFSAVVQCLREARRRSANAYKCTVFYLACKLALLLLFALLLIAEGASPMTPVQVIVIKLVADLGATRAMLAEQPEGLIAKSAENPASLTALARADQIVHGSEKYSSTARSVVFYAAALFVACALPLLVPSVLLPSWAVAPVAPTLTFLTWMAAHALLGISMSTRLLPLRVFRNQQSRTCHANRPGLIWLAASLAVILLASTIPPLSAHLDVVPLNVAEWAMVIASPLLMFGGLELIKELRYRWLVPNANGIVDVERQQLLSS